MSTSRTMDYDRLVAANIRRYRNLAKMTQEQVAREAGISPQHLSKVERCVCSPTINTIVRIANCVGIHPKDLFDSSDFDTLVYMYTDMNT